MAKKISQLPVASSLDGTELLEVVQAGASKQAAVNLLDMTQFGTYAGRPAASSVRAKTIYYATDVLEAYRSDGSVWSVIPASSSELGYAERTSTFSTSSASAVDVPGLSVTCKVGERPVVMSYGGSIRNSTAGAFARILAIANAATQSNITVPGSGNYLTQSRETRISGLTPGSTYTFKLQLLAISGGTSDFYSDATDRAYLQVRSA